MFDRLSTRLGAALSLFLSLSIIGCGGGGGGGGGAGAGATGATIDFPPADAKTHALSMTVTGTDVTSGEITVNGVVATRGAGDAWSATISLPLDLLDLVVARDGVEVVRQSLDNRTPALTASGVEVDPMTGDIYVSDGTSNRIYQIDGTTGAIVTIADESDGLANPEDLALDSFRNRLYVNDGGFRILVVDLATGTVSTTSSGSVGTGPILTSMSGLEFDAGNDVETDDTLFVTEYTSGRVYSINCLSGNRASAFTGSVFGVGNGLGPMAGFPTYLIVTESFNTGGAALTSINPADGSPGGVLSNAMNGSGPAFELPEDVVEDAANDRAYVADARIGVISVDTTTMNREALAPIGEEDGIRVDEPFVIDLDPMSGNVIVGDGDFGSILEIAPNGQRTELMGSRRGDGPPIGRPGGAVFSNGELLLCGEDGDILAVDPRTGSRSLVSGAGRGVGQTLARVVDIAITDSGDEIFALERTTGVYRIDRATGDRVHVTPMETNTGLAISHDPSRNAVLVAYANDAIVLVDLATGSRTDLLSSAGLGGPVIDLVYDPPSEETFVVYSQGEVRSLGINTGGVSFNLVSFADTIVPRAAVLDEANYRIVLTGDTAVFQIDLTTGNRSTLSEDSGLGGTGAGRGYPLRNASAIAIDPATGFIHVGTFTSIVTVSDSGDRVLVSR